MEIEIAVEDGLVEKVLSDLRRSYTRELVDCSCANSIINQIDTQEEREIIKRAIVRVLLAWSWTQRLYFIVRSTLMGSLSAVLTLTVIWYFRSIDVIQGFILGIFLFISSLVITRLFETKIVRFSKRIVRYLGQHNRLRTLIVNNF